MREKIRLIGIFVFAFALCLGGNTLAKDNEKTENLEATQDGNTVTGVVSDASGPVPGVNVSVKGTSIGTATDLEGKFTLRNVKSGSSITFSIIGYKTQVVGYKGEQKISILLEEDTKLLSEVVVTALGIPKENRALGYSTSTISAKEITKVGTPNFATALYGKAAGVRIQSSTGGNTSSVSVTIRGLNSLTGNTQPMLIVDGVPVRNGNANNDNDRWNEGRGGIGSNGLVDINPEDIETVTILKGAAASALYGSEAANGVILVTTKKSTTNGGLGIDFNMLFQNNYVAFMPKVQNEYGPGRPVLQRDNEYQRLHDGLDQMTYNGQVSEYAILRSSFSYGPKYDGRPILYWDGTIRKYEAITDSPYSDLFRTGFNQTYNIAFTKSDDKNSSRFSYTYVDDLPNQYNSTYGKHNFSLTGLYKLHDRIKVDYSANYIRQNVKNRPGTIGAMIDNMSNQFHSFDDVNTLRNMVMTSLGYENRNAGEATLTPNESYAYDNPTAAKGYLWGVVANENLETNTRFIASVSPSWRIIDGLTFRGRLSSDFSADAIENKSRTSQPLILRLGERNKTGSYSARNKLYDIYYGDVMLMFDRNLTDKINLTSNLGYSGRIEKMLQTSTETQQGLSVENWFHLNASVEQVQAGMYKSELLKTAYFGTLGASYDHFIYAEGTLRQEKTSTLAPGSNTFWYPSINTSFIYTEAFKDAIPAWYDYGKARISYGVVGNAPDIYRANIAYTQGLINNIPYNLLPSDIGNDALRPETKYEWEFGLESKFFKNRLGIEVSYYNNKVEDQILPVPAIPSMGGTSLLQNIGTLQNYGLEISLNVRPFETNDFYWDLIFNYGLNRGKVVALSDGADVLDHGQNNANMAGSVRVQSRVGSQMGDIFTYMPKTDANGNRLINTTGGNYGLYMIDYGDENLVKIGNAIPTGVGGIGSSFKYKNFYLDFMIDFRIGGYIVSDGFQYTAARGINPITLAYRDLDHGGIAYYFPNNDMNPEHTIRADGLTQGPNGEKVYYNGMIVPGVKGDANRQSTGEVNDIIVPSDKYYNYVYNVGNEEPTYFGNSVFENSYMKLRELSFSYRLSPKLISKFGCKSLTLSVFGRNLFYFYKNKSGYDPETTSGTAWNNQVFLGTSTTASTRTFGLSLRSSF
jgi:TonB-linked SusC/RagA family outer membrane protein